MLAWLEQTAETLWTMDSVCFWSL